MTKPFITIQCDDKCNLDIVPLFSLALGLSKERFAPFLHLICLPISLFIRSNPLDKSSFPQHCNSIVNGRPAETTDNSQFFFRNIWVIPDFSQYFRL